MTEMKVTGAIFDFSQYEYMIVESDDGKVIAEIRQDQIDVEDGYRVRMMPRKEQAKKGVILHSSDINFVSKEAEKKYYESL